MASSIEKIPRFIAVEGPIGVGKTSLTRRLAAHLGAELLLEGAADNPFLPQYYGDRSRYALATQLHFLCQRTRQLQPWSQTDLFVPAVIADFIFDKDRLFAQIALDDQEFALYDEIFKRFAPQVPIPDLVIYLAAPVDVLLRRIETRGIGYERAIDAAYLERLIHEYARFFQHYQAAPVLMVDAARLDLLSHTAHFGALVATIHAGIRGKQALDILDA